MLARSGGSGCDLWQAPERSFWRRALLRAAASHARATGGRMGRPSSSGARRAKGARGRRQSCEGGGTRLMKRAPSEAAAAQRTPTVLSCITTKPEARNRKLRADENADTCPLVFKTEEATCFVVGFYHFYHFFAVLFCSASCCDVIPGPTCY